MPKPIMLMTMTRILARISRLNPFPMCFLCSSIPHVRIDGGAPRRMLTYNMEAQYYHALHLACGGDYKAIEKLKKIHGTWENAWHAHATHKTEIDPERAWHALTATGISLILR